MRKEPILAPTRAVLAAIVVLVTAWLIISSIGPGLDEHPLLWTLAAILFVLNSLPVLYEVLFREEGPDPFSPILWLSFGFFLRLAMYVMSNLNAGEVELEANTIPPGTTFSYLFPVIGLGVLSIICLLAGYYSSYGQRLAEVVPSFSPGWSSRRAWIGVIAFLAIGGLGYYGLVGSIGTGPRSELTSGSTMVSFIAINFLNAAALVAVADSFVSVRRGDPRNPLRDPLGWLRQRLRPYHITIPKGILAIIVLFGCVYLLWQLSGRGRAFTPLVGVVFLLHYILWRMPYPVGAAFVFVRRFMSAWGAAVAASLLTLDVGNVITTATDFGGGNPARLTQANNLTILLAGIPDMVDYQYGVTFASAFFAPLPISPFPQTQFVYNDAFLGGNHDYGVPISLMGELFLNFWIPGVIIGMVIVGIVMRFAYRWLITGTTSTNIAGAVLFATITDNFLLIGSFSNSAPAMGLRVLPMAVLLLYITGVHRRLGRRLLSSLSRSMGNS